VSEIKRGKSKGKTNWDKLRARQKTMPSPSEKDRKETAEFWADADVVIPEGKTRMTARFDTDLVEWFKSYGPKYQTRMNAVLRQFMCNQAEHKTSNAVRSAMSSETSGSAVTLEVREQAATEYLEALNQLGKICLHKGDHDGASKHFQEVVNCYRRQIEGNRFGGAGP
jgi:uncharacterized protein (DUF4415 family)